MEQRRLRLGDILDDYCPRERRVTNHAVVAMIEEDVKQTRCTTCDAEHAYKNARVPARRSKKESPAALYKEVLAGMPETDDVPVLAAAAPAVPAGSVLSDVPAALVTPPSGQSRDPEEELDAAVDEISVEADGHDDEIPSDEDAAEYAPSADGDDAPVDGPVHRPLIRATLPRIEGQKDARPVPDFTIRHAPARGNGNGHGFRDRMRGRGNGSAYGNGNGNGNRSHGGPRFQGNRSSGGRPPMGRAGAPSSFRGNGNGHGNGNGNKRGRGPR